MGKSSETYQNYLEIITPEGKKFTFNLEDKEIITLGRDADNDIHLENPEKHISRKHCRLEKINNFYWLIDDDSEMMGGKPSASGTFIRLSNSQEYFNIQTRENNRIRLSDGDIFYLIAKIISPSDPPLYWQFIFHDANTTIQPPLPVSGNLSTPQEYIAYSESLQTLVKVMGNKQEVIKLAPNPRSLIRYMVNKNLENNKQRTLCFYPQLIEAVWGKDDTKYSGSVNHLVYQIRQKIEPNPAKPQYILNEKTDGYSLEIEYVD